MTMVLTAPLLALALASVQADPLAAGFRNPPPSARPHTWWHWMDGNVTKEGITADLEAMKQVGIGGAQMFTVAQGIPKGPVDYLSPKWREMTKWAAREAGRLGIELCIHNCAGWSSSGGPWVKPEHAMQVLSWSTVNVSGPKHFDEALPGLTPPQIYGSVDYRKDIAVYAFPTQGEGAPTLPREAGPERTAILGKTGVIRVDGLNPDIRPGLGGVPMAQFRNLTPQFANGRLVWDVPPGKWTILRLGYIPTGKDNHPAPPEGDGLEVDKLSREAMDEFWSGTMATVIKDLGPLAGKVLNNALIDSYEVGGQNWTPKFAEEFRKRRGYDCMPWLPTVTGMIIESPEKTERFLWDFRRTIADLFADNYYLYFKELCHRHGLQFSTEPYGSGNFDNLQVGGLADIPMGEFWVGGGTLETLKVASSAAHTNGRPVVGAESFTADDYRGRWLEEPYAAKALGDLVFCNGINRYIFHRYAHQPWMDKFPGMTMGPWGTHLERTQTWWTEAATWMKYVARCQYLLQKGNFVADALYYTGEGAPVDLPYRPYLQPTLPNGFDYDGCDTTALMKLHVKDGRVTLPDGMSYRVLVLPESRFMTPAVLHKITNLIYDGAVVVGNRVDASPSLVDFPDADAQIRDMANQIWGENPAPSGSTQMARGWVYWGTPLKTVFDRLRTAPDFEYVSTSGGSKLAYIHRQIEGAEVYFVSNQKYLPTEVDCTFRVAGRTPEIWHADTGETEEAPVFRQQSGRTTVPLRLEPAESVFLIFRKPTSGQHLTTFGPDKPLGQVKQPPQVTIKSGRYEAADGRGADVTEKVIELVKQGENEIAATNSNFGDPVVNVRKRLVLEYEIDGKPMKKTVEENEVIVLFEVTGNASSTPTYDLQKSSSGALTLIPWMAGNYSGSDGSATRVSENALAMELAGPWRLEFKPGWGAPPSTTLDRLVSWTENPDPGIRYFSGSATYVKEFTLPRDMAGPNRAVMLDLGRVKNFATVKLNGLEVAVLWKEPFRLDVSKRIRPGRNLLEVKVTNLWPNRIIGDEQLPADVEWNGTMLKGWPEWLVKGEPRPKTGRYTFTTWRFWNKDSPLLESGLLGPVVIRSAKRIPLGSAVN